MCLNQNFNLFLLSSLQRFHVPEGCIGWKSYFTSMSGWNSWQIQIIISTPCFWLDLSLNINHVNKNDKYILSIYIPSVNTLSIYVLFGSQILNTEKFSKDYEIASECVVLTSVMSYKCIVIDLMRNLLFLRQTNLTKQLI